ncbi:hypothetical protein GGR50DRAFT_287466 [Xylaria sp. CBS 124048]|nr:hypothetical protein GGR50DRAFT_287466 [Xylaria sp. CBS 124048]
MTAKSEVPTYEYKGTWNVKSRRWSSMDKGTPCHVPYLLRGVTGDPFGDRSGSKHSTSVLPSPTARSKIPPARGSDGPRASGDNVFVTPADVVLRSGRGTPADWQHSETAVNKYLRTAGPADFWVVEKQLAYPLKVSGSIAALASPSPYLDCWLLDTRCFAFVRSAVSVRVTLLHRLNLASLDRRIRRAEDSRRQRKENTGEMTSYIVWKSQE